MLCLETQAVHRELRWGLGFSRFSRYFLQALIDLGPMLLCFDFIHQQ